MKSPQRRFLTPDLSPRDRTELASLRPRAVFIAESPHVNEIAPAKKSLRRPLCGAAGRQWWSLLSELLEGEENDDVSLQRELEVCLRHRIVVMNAVQYPLDPKIAKEFPEADPVTNLGFNKVAGPYSFKRLRKTEVVQAAIQDLRQRLSDPALKGVPIYCLGNDSHWLVNYALGEEEAKTRIKDKIPHPSAWWRKSGHYGRLAKEKLITALKTKDASHRKPASGD